MSDILKENFEILLKNYNALVEDNNRQRTVLANHTNNQKEIQIGQIKSMATALVAERGYSIEDAINTAMEISELVEKRFSND